jgi:hypothetical protein
MTQRRIVQAVPLLLMAAEIGLLLVLLTGVASAAGNVVGIRAGGDTVFADGAYSLREGQTGMIHLGYLGPRVAAQGVSPSITIDGTTIDQDETATLNGVSFTPVKLGTMMPTPIDKTMAYLMGAMSAGASVLFTFAHVGVFELAEITPTCRSGACSSERCIG